MKIHINFNVLARKNCSEENTPADICDAPGHMREPQRVGDALRAETHK